MEQPLYYDRDGNPITLWEWGHLIQTPAEERRIGRDTVHDHLISTVYLGLDHSLWGQPPLIYETMIFCQHQGECPLNNWCERYPTLENAQTGHQSAVTMVKLENHHA